MTFTTGDSLTGGPDLRDGEFTEEVPLQQGPCARFCTADDVTAHPGREDLGDDPVVLDLAIDVATEVMWGATGRQFSGGCEMTIRPTCVDDLSRSGNDLWRAYAYPYTPVIAAGRWYNLAPGCRCQTYESGRLIPQVDLGLYPVTAARVTIDGALLPPSHFRVHQWRYLVRTDGQAWPLTQNLLADLTEPDTWGVTCRYGRPPTKGVVAATAELAADLAKGMLGRECQIAKSVTNVTRQGVSFQRASIKDVVQGGNTGLIVVDMVVGQINPNKLMQRPRVASPDTRRAYRRG